PPAPTRPVVIGPSAAASQAASPEVSSGYAPDSPTPRSKRIAPGTIGTRAFPTAKPTPRRASHDMTPLAAARPKALPPEKTTAWTSETRFPGVNTPVSLARGAPPPTPPAAIVPGGGRITVHPVRRSPSVQCPIL